MPSGTVATLDTENFHLPYYTFEDQSAFVHGSTAVNHDITYWICWVSFLKLGGIFDCIFGTVGIACGRGAGR